MKKTLRITILLSVFGMSTASLLAAPVGGAPRPQAETSSVLSDLVAAAAALLGM